MVSVQDEELIQCVDDRGIDLLHLVGKPEGHPDEVLGVGTRGVRVKKRQAGRALCDVRDHRGHLGHEERGGQIKLCRILRIKRVIVVGGHSSNAGLQDGHRVATSRERGEEGLEVLVQQRVPLDPAREQCERLGVRELAVDQEVGNLSGRNSWQPAVRSGNRGIAKYRRHHRYM